MLFVKSGNVKVETVMTSKSNVKELQNWLRRNKDAYILDIISNVY